MTKEEAREAALDEYWAAINDHDITNPKTKARVLAAHKALLPFMEIPRGDTSKKIPLDLRKRFEAKK